LLQQFVGKEGQTVTINYKIDEYKGKQQYTVLGIAGTTTGLPPAAPRVLPPVSQGPPPLVPITPARKDENISVLALVKVYQGQLQVGDRQALVSALRMCRSAWREFQTGDVRPSFKEDFNDEIPKFEDGKDIEDTY
jgi:hypothetical protein